MAYKRQHPRTTQTEDLSATLRSAGRTCERVLNLSHGGMLVASSGLEVDETAGFELAGPDFRFAGVAKVAHRSDQATGLRFLSWQGSANRAVWTLIAARLRGHRGSRDVALEPVKAIAKTGLLFEDPASSEYDPRTHIAEHPDTPERIEAIDAALAAVGWLGWDQRIAPMATRGELEAVHDTGLIDTIEQLAAAGGGPIDEDTYVDAASYRAARYAAGAACAMVRALIAGEARIAFVAMRPSGHHAERSRAMGFCLFNNIAAAAQLAIDRLGVRRVFILDWDVHHGNGTAEIFRRRDDVLFASIHQANIFPHSGPLRDAGSHAGLGYTINLPVPAGSDGELWLSLLEHVVIPAATAFGPELVLISAGFDAHRADPLGGCLLESCDFARMARHVRDLAHHAGAPIGVVLEGGYDPSALAESVIATMRALAGYGAAEQIAPDSIYTRRAASFAGHHWGL